MRRCCDQFWLDFIPAVSTVELPDGKIEYAGKGNPGRECKMLANEADETRRQTLRHLLAEEEAKLAATEHTPKRSDRAS